jgi:uncharacterized repeat protein (TIGR01451 family)
VLAYDRSVQTLYLGMRVAGVIGDPDGNGNPDTRCPEATFEEEVGIGFNDSYTWEINTDCAGAPEITIEVRDNQVTITGASGNATYAFNGSDLEVAVENLVLPDAYEVRIFAGNIVDGLGEDLHDLTCAPAGPQILVDKTANPERICPNQNTTFTIVVTNPGGTALQSVNLVDDLPANLTYVGGSASNNCGAGAPNVNGQQITWPAFSLAAGASCTFTFQATAGAQCAGEQVNVATASGTFSSPCFNEGEPQTVQDSDDATVTCLPAPCVEITAMNAPGEACANTNVQITGTVQNCSSESETISVTLNGGAPQNLGIVTAGGTANFSFTTSVGACTPGQNVAFTAVATASNECGEDTDSETRNLLCGEGPCVQVSLDAPDNACVGEPIQVTANVTNCGDSAANFSVTVGGQSHDFGSLGAGQNASHTFTFTVQNCVEGGVNYEATATASNECGQDTATDSERVLCETPDIDVEKTAESSVPNGGTIHYVITVSNPGSTPLENVEVTDELCPYARYAGNANPAPFSEPAVGSGGSVVWHIASLGANESVQLTFEATADVAFGGGQCPTTVTCTNHVVATGFCAGTGTSGTPARDEDDFPTTITCAADNCPRTVGYWGAQCAQRGNGSSKYTADELEEIAECIDDEISFFNWSSGTDLDRFCSILDPAKPMTAKKQALRQFAGTLANLCVDDLDIEPSQGGTVRLDPETPISCPPFEADTIGELIDEIDDRLTELEGEDPGSAEARAGYAAIVSCFDGINNGENIPTSEACGDTTESTSEFGMSDASRAELALVVPNPFAASMSYSYEVPDGGTQMVDIGIYNVAGRLITRLASEVQGPGRYTVRWDGRDASGIAMARGVYFLKSRIGGTESVGRLLKIAD